MYQLELELMPRDPFGHFIYHRSIPLPIHKIKVNDVTLMDSWKRYLKHEATENDLEALKQYVFYYLNAPAFDNPATWDLLEKITLQFNLDQLIDECLNHGFDPF